MRIFSSTLPKGSKALVPKLNKSFSNYGALLCPLENLLSAICERANLNGGIKTMNRSLNVTALAVLVALSAIALGCTASASNSAFFGKATPPRDNVLRYVSGSEPQSLDPQIPTSQPDARICMALYEGLTEYDPKTTAPIPALAERWEVNKDSSEFTFHLRHNARFSNRDPITARDFVYTFRRGLNPETAARNASLAYYI